jgi:hypothetical protein
MTILSQLLQKVRKNALMIYTGGTLFQLTPGAYLPRPVESFVYRNNGMEFVQNRTEPLDTFSDLIRPPIEDLFQTEMEKAASVASSLQQKYDALKAKSDGKPAPDVTIPEYKPVDFNKRIDELTKTFPYTTVGLYRNHVIHFSQRPARKPSPSPQVLYGTREWGLSPLFNLRDIMQDELRAKNTSPDSALHKNDHLKDRICMYQFYLDNIFRKDDEYELKIREVGKDVQVYVDVPEHIIEDVKVEARDKPWYRFPPTQAWMTLGIERGTATHATPKAYLPATYMHPFSEPDQYWVCIAGFDGGLVKKVLGDENAEDPGKYIRWVLKNSADVMLYGYTETCAPWRPFADPRYAPLYARHKVDKKACTSIPDNRRD